jgi:serine protease Do
MRAKRSRVASSLPALLFALASALGSSERANAQDAAAELQRELRSIADQASAAVVAIQVPGGLAGSENPWDAQARASGFLVAPEGHILTDARCVRGRRRVDVRLRGGLRATARVIGVDTLNSTAVLQLDDVPALAERMGGRLPALAFGTSVDLRVGQSVFTVSNAFDSLAVDGAPSFSWGNVTSIGRVRAGGDYKGVAIETDAAVNPGSFGGPLLDRGGRVVGIVSVPFSTGRWLGMAVPMDQVRLGFEDIVAGRSLTQGFLGLAVKTTGGEARPDGVEVSRVVDGSPSASAGLQVGDRVVALDGRTIFDAEDIGRELEPLAPGSRVTLRVRRGEAERDVRVVLGRGETPVVVRAPARPTAPARPQPQAQRPQPQPQAPAAKATLGVRTMNRAGGGVQVVEVVPNSAAARAGLVPGDVLLGLGSERLATLLDLRRVLDAKRPGDRVQLSFERDGKVLRADAVLDTLGQAPTAPAPAPTPARASGFLGVYLRADAAATSATVDRVAPGSPAEAAGLRAGDVIVGVDGRAIAGATPFADAVRGRAAGDAVRLEVLRGKQRVAVRAVLASAPGASAAPAPGPRAWLGAALVARAGRVTIDEVDPRGPAAQAALRKGDVILEASGRAVRTLEDFEAALSPLAPGARLELLVERDGWSKPFQLTLAQRP